MENMDDNIKKIVVEHPEGGTEVAFGEDQQLKESRDTLEMEHLAALQANDENKAKEIEVKINEINEKLGWDEEKLAA